MTSSVDLPEAVRQLQLRRAFKGHSPGIEKCMVITSEVKFAIADDDVLKHSVIVPFETEDKCCYIYNPKETEVVLLQIDNKLIANRPGGIADCAVFNTVLFCFVEFKTNAEGNTDEAIKATYRKAAEQLKTTLQLFVNKEKAIGIDFLNTVETECHIIVNQIFPCSRTAEQTLQLEFAGETATLLSFEDFIEF